MERIIIFRKLITALIDLTRCKLWREHGAGARELDCGKWMEDCRNWRQGGQKIRGRKIWKWG